VGLIRGGIAGLGDRNQAVRRPCREIQHPAYCCWWCGRKHIGRLPRFCEECGRPPLQASDCDCQRSQPYTAPTSAVRAYCGDCGGWIKRSTPSRALSRSARKRRIYRQLGIEGRHAENGNIAAGQDRFKSGPWTRTPGKRPATSPTLTATTLRSA